MTDYRIADVAGKQTCVGGRRGLDLPRLHRAAHPYLGRGWPETETYSRHGNPPRDPARSRNLDPGSSSRILSTRRKPWRIRRSSAVAGCLSAVKGSAFTFRAGEVCARVHSQPRLDRRFDPARPAVAAGPGCYREAGPVAVFAVGGIAVLPGMMNAFLVTGLLLDRRPPREPARGLPGDFDPGGRLQRRVLDRGHAPLNCPAEVSRRVRSLVIDDGSKDATAAIVEANPYPWARLLRQPRNLGKAAALNRGLAESRHDYVITLDADSFLFGDALAAPRRALLQRPSSTRAVAGTMLVRNSRRNWITRAQEWDFFHGIAAIKRVQSLFRARWWRRAPSRSTPARRWWKSAAGGRRRRGLAPTWALFVRGCVSVTPRTPAASPTSDNLRQFVKQRQRWSRGMMEAFRQHPRIL